MRKFALLLAAAALASPAFAQEEAPGAIVAPETEGAPPLTPQAEPAPAPGPVAVNAAPVAVTAGEHGDFSRIVVSGAGANLTQSGRTVKIALDSTGDADLSVLTNRKRAERVAGARLIPSGAGNDIVLDLACDCRVKTTRLPNGKFVVDIYDGQRIAAPAQQPAQSPTLASAPVSPAPVQTAQPAATAAAETKIAPPQPAGARIGDAHNAGARNAGALSVGAHGENIVAAGADKLSVDEARKRMVALLQQAANDGIITVKPGSDELTAPAQSESAKPAPSLSAQGPVVLAKPAAPSKASIPGKPPFAAPAAKPAAPEADSGESAAADAAPKPAPAPVAAVRSQAACLPDAAFTIDGRKFAESPLEEIGALQSTLAEAQVDAKPAIAERLALGYLAIGFGEEALGVLASIGDSQSLYADMARIAAEKPPAPEGLLMRGAQCRGAHALWLAAVEEPSEAMRSVGRAGDAINSVPMRLRGALAARIARAMVAAGDAADARRYYQIALKASGKTPELKFVEAKLLELEGETEDAHAILDELEHENGRAAKDALGALAAGENRDTLGEDLGVLAKSARGTAEEGRAALREASFWADSGAIESGVFLLRDAAQRDPSIAPEAVRKARETIMAAFQSGEPKKRVAALAAYLHDQKFLQSEGGDAEIARLASDAAVEFGVPNAAFSILKTTINGDGLGAARLARAALAADAAEDAVAVAAPYADQPDFAHVLVKANIELGRGYAALAAASALPESANKAALTAEAAWRARDYKSAARAFAKIDPASLDAGTAERFGYAAYLAGEPALPAAAEAVLREAKSPALARLQQLFKPSGGGAIVERTKSALAGAGDDIKLIEEILGG